MNKEELKLKYEQMSNEDLMDVLNKKTFHSDKVLGIVRMIMQARGQSIKFDEIEQQDKVPNDYPMTDFFSRSLNIIAVLYALLGAIAAGFAMYNQQVIGFFSSLAFGAIGWAILKFMAEGVKILSDVANNIKAIRLHFLSIEK
tara:strand:- start:434 stop:862 length:429 start_codon:yes stop_codon:yes gene_type:complete